MKKIISFLLAIILVLSSCVIPALAENGIDPRDSAYFSSYGTTLSRQGGGCIKITFTANALEISDTLGVSTYQVERLEEDGDWVDCSGLLNGKTISGFASYTFSKYFYGFEGETYRVKVIFICGIDNGVETKAYTSGSITAN
ncbi:MAG: hypothetical protein E7329_12455 [Clostridiales bacterium]|nr:hypothetical protein [Clostridiales bacterium]